MRISKVWPLALAAALLACEDTSDDSAVTLEAPTVNPLGTVCDMQQTITGTKQSNTSIWLNGMEIVPIDEQTTFTAMIPLMEGVQTLRVWAQDATGEASERVQIQVTVDLTPPDAPVVENAPMNGEVVQETSFELLGTKPANTSIQIDGVEVIPTDDQLTWKHTVQLMSEQTNRFTIQAHDGCRPSTAVVVDIFQDPTGIRFSVSSGTTTPACTDSQEICGERGDGVSVQLNGNEVVAPGASDWCYTVQLEEGNNTLNFTGAKEGRVSAPREFTIEYDATPPTAPMLSAMVPDYTCEQDVMLVGTKEANTNVTVNDVVMEQTNTNTMFSFASRLTDGLNILQIDSEDSCGRTSGNPTVVRITLDTQMPSATLTSPTNMSNVSGLVEISGDSSDMGEGGVAAVEIQVDGNMVDRVTTTSTFTTSWDSTSVADGMHLIGAIAIDRAGKRSPPATVMVDVSNSARVVSEEGPVPSMDPSLARSARPSVTALTDGNTAVAWHDNFNLSESGNDDDVILRLFRSGTTPQATVIVSSPMMAGVDGRSQNVRLAAGPNATMHVVWQDDGDYDNDRNVEKDIVYRHFTGGQLASAYTVVSPGDSEASWPDVATDSMGTVHVVWQDNGDLDGDGNNDLDIYYTTGGPMGFNQPVLISNCMGDGESQRPRIAIDPTGCPHITWADTGACAANDTNNGLDIYYRGSTAGTGGTCSFGPTVRISEEPQFTASLRPRIVADPMDPRGLLWIAWEGLGNVANNGMDRDVFLRNVFQNATGPLIVVSDDAMDGFSQAAGVTVDAMTNVHVAWVDNGDIAGTGMDQDVFTRSWNGVSLTQTAAVSDIGMNAVNTEVSTEPDIAARGLQVFVTWADESNYDGDSVPDADILYVVR